MIDVSEQEASVIVALQRGIPLVSRPFQKIAETYGLTENDVIEIIRKWMSKGGARRLGGIFDARRIGFSSALCNMSVPDDRLDEIAAHVVAVPGITHVYVRSWPKELPKDSFGGPRNHHWPNLWFTLATRSEIFEQELNGLKEKCAGFPICALPALHRFKIDVVFNLRTRERDETVGQPPGTPLFVRDQEPPVVLDEEEKKIIRLFQGHLEPVPEFFKAAADQLGMSEGELINRLQAWLDSGALRRIALLLFHRQVGFKANGMCCWNASPDEVMEKGRKLAQFPEVTHCYERPWTSQFPFRLYAMIHTGSWEKTQALFRRLTESVGLSEGQLLFSIREFKKTSMKFF